MKSGASANLAERSTYAWTRVTMTYDPLASRGMVRSRAHMLEISRHLLSLFRRHARQERYARLRQPRTDNSQWRDVCRAGDRRCDAADAADQTNDAPRGRASSIVQAFKLRFLSLEPCERVPLGSNEPLISQSNHSQTT